jgi:hypothetical protein
MDTPSIRHVGRVVYRVAERFKKTSQEEPSRDIPDTVDPMPEPSALDALLDRLERILTRHAVVHAYIEPGSDGEMIVVCRCKMRFDAGEAHAIHQTRVIRGWFAEQAARHAVAPHAGRLIR